VTPDVRARAGTSGQVRSVHRAAIYIDLEGTDELLVIAVEDVGGVPGGIVVRGAADLRIAGIAPGVRFRPSPDGWAIPSADLQISSSNAVCWSPKLPATARVDGSARTAERVLAARRLASAEASGGLAPLLTGLAGPLGPLADPWLVRGAALVSAQLAALGRADVQGAMWPTIDLIGLGVGLTPSGDDYLVGLLAGLEAAHQPARAELAATVVAHARSRTTSIGVSSLVHAASGAYAERVHDVLAAIADDQARGLERAIRRLLAYGATSGGDLLVGLFAALDVSMAPPNAAACDGRAAAA
jgi:hypothetical protein